MRDREATTAETTNGRGDLPKRTMLQALLSGVASIKAHQTRMNVIGNNLANVNTTAYKGSRVGFQDMLSQTVQGASAPNSGQGGRNSIQYGLGVTVGATAVNGEQGSLGATNRPTDLAIQGNGYFVVADAGRQYFTRDGSFDTDESGTLVHRGTGARLLGWTADANGKIDNSKTIEKDSYLKFETGSQKALQITSRATLTGNLNSSATATDKVTSNIRVFDSLGVSHDLTVVMSNHKVPPTGTAPTGATSSWDWTAYEGATTGTPIGSSTTAGNGPLYFDANGASVSSLAAGALNKVTMAGSPGASPTFPIDLDFKGLSSVDQASSASFATQNGFEPGSLSGIAIGSDGVITGIFSNGLNRTLGQVALATFANAEGLDRVSDNMWSDSANSGLANIAAPKQTNHGSLSAGYLEQSNVDISSEFTDLIVTQRGFQANTKIVTTVDQMLEELINLRR